MLETATPPSWAGYALLFLVGGGGLGIGTGLYKLGNRIGELGQVLHDLERRLSRVEDKQDRAAGLARRGRPASTSPTGEAPRDT